MNCGTLSRLLWETSLSLEAGKVIAPIPIVWPQFTMGTRTLCFHR